MPRLARKAKGVNAEQAVAAAFFDLLEEERLRQLSIMRGISPRDRSYYRDRLDLIEDVFRNVMPRTLALMEGQPRTFGVIALDDPETEPVVEHFILVSDAQPTPREHGGTLTTGAGRA